MVLIGRKVGISRLFTEDGSSLPIDVVEVSVEEAVDEIDFKDVSESITGGIMRETRIPERRCYWSPTQSPTEFYDGFSIHFNSTPPKYHNRFDNRATELRAKVHAKRRLAKGKRK